MPRPRDAGPPSRQTGACEKSRQKYSLRLASRVDAQSGRANNRRAQCKEPQKLVGLATAHSRSCLDCSSNNCADNMVFSVGTRPVTPCNNNCNTRGLPDAGAKCDIVQTSARLVAMTIHPPESSAEKFAHHELLESGGILHPCR